MEAISYMIAFGGGAAYMWLAVQGYKSAIAVPVLTGSACALLLHLVK